MIKNSSECSIILNIKLKPSHVDMSEESIDIIQVNEVNTNRNWEVIKRRRQEEVSKHANFLCLLQGVSQQGLKLHHEIKKKKKPTMISN